MTSVATFQRDIRRFLAYDTRAGRLSLLLITALGIALRLRYIDQPVRFDEGFTYATYAAGSWWKPLTDYSYPNNHVLHTLLVHIAAQLFGDSPWAIRLPAFTAGVLLIPTTYWAGRLLYGRLAGIVGAALVATAPALILYATDARGYSLVCLLTLLLVGCACYLRRRVNLAAWCLFAVTVTLGLYTIPIMLYSAGGVALWYILEVRGDPAALRRLAGALLAAGVLAFTLYLPIIVHSGLRALIANPYVSPAAGTLAYGIGAWVGTAWQDAVADYPAPLLVVLVLAVAWGHPSQRAPGRERVSLLLCMVLWSAVLVLLTRRVPFMRVGLFAFPILALTAGAGLADGARRLGNAWRRVIGAAMLLALALQSVYVAAGDRVLRSSDLADASALAATLAPDLHPGVRVLMGGDSLGSLLYYFQVRGLPTSYLTASAPLTVGTTVYLVVNTQWQESAAVIEAENGVHSRMLTAPRIVGTYPHALLYRADLARH